MFFAKTPVLIMKLFPELIWRFTSREDHAGNDLYLTFDDGPTPEVTPWVLDQLKKHGARATFFCIGRNVDKHPEIYRRILHEGHAVGNHTFSHLKGWNTENSEYIQDIQLARKAIESRLFRPPYGKFRKSQIREIRKSYDIVMWDVLSQDYDRNVTPEKCLANVRENIRPGSIIVFHDSVKASPNLYYTLPRLLEEFGSAFQFRAIGNHGAHARMTAFGQSA